MNFENMIFIVTGSSSGIGRGCAEKLLSLNASVAGFDKQPTDLSDQKYRHVVVDVSDDQGVKAAVDEVDAVFGKIDGLVNGAGIYSCSKPFYEINSDEWNKLISINLTGTFICCRHAAIKMMKHSMGKIVNISCIRSRIFRPNMADYAASKGGVVALTSAMALDLAPFNIQVNSVAPGFTYTGMTAEDFDNLEIRASSEKIIPLGRIAEPSDISNVVVFLLSDQSDYITGETIFTDGGFKISK